MTSSQAAGPATCTVVLLGSNTPSEPALYAALVGLPTAPHIRWTVVRSGVAAGDAHIVVCADAEQVSEATRCWPGAATIALVSPRDDGAGVVAAFAAGAHVCVRGAEADLVAAYVHSLARRTQPVIGAAASR